MATAFQIQDQILVGAATDQGLHHGIGIAQPLVLLPGANSIFHGLFYTFCAGSKKDRCKPDHFCMVIRDHIADYSLVALFLHTVQKIAGAFPVIYGERENIYMDLEKIAEVFAMTVRDWKPKRANLVPVFWAILIQRSTS